MERQTETSAIYKLGPGGLLCLVMINQYRLEYGPRLRGSFSSQRTSTTLSARRVRFGLMNSLKMFFFLFDAYLLDWAHGLIAGAVPGGHLVPNSSLSELWYSFYTG